MNKQAWAGSDRRSRLPDDWDQIRLVIGRRDGWICQQITTAGTICGKPANQVDHIERGDDHSYDNLQCLCSDCHSKKSSSEGGWASVLALRAAKARTARPKEKHPEIPVTGKPLFPGL